MFWKPSPNKLLLKAAFGPPDQAIQFWEEYKTNTPLNSRHNSLASICGHILKNLQSGGFDDPYLRTMSKINFLRTSARINEASEILIEMKRRFEVNPLKGFAAIQSGLSQSFRSIQDIDLYIYPEEVNKVIFFLESLGFTPAHGVSTIELFTHIFPKRGSWSLVRGEIDFDIHWRMFDHLTVKENAKLARAFFPQGNERERGLELAMAHSLFHDFYQAHDIYQGLYDFISLKEKVNNEVIWNIARKTKLTNHFGELHEIVSKEVSLGLFEDILTEPESPYFALVDFEIPRTAKVRHPQFFNRWQVKTEISRASRKIQKCSVVYWIWDRCCRSARVEKFLLSIFGSFTKTDSNLPNEYVEGPGVSRIECLGVGWSWRNPGWKGRYSEGPDARLALSVKRDLKRKDNLLVFKLELDSDMWNFSTAGEVDLFASGYFLGTIKHEQYSYVFDLPKALNTREVIEFSLRPKIFHKTKLLGEGTHWYRLSTPIASAKIAVSPQ